MARLRSVARFIQGSIVQKFKKELKDFDTSKGTIRFSSEKPLPNALVRRIVKARLAQQERNIDF